MVEDNIINQIFFDKYKATKRLGNGSFGVVYQGINLKTEELIAIKLEAREENTNLLETEAYRLIYLKGEGVPKVFCYGNNKTYNILVIELLGKSLEDLFNFCSRKFSLKTVCVLAIEMLKRIEYVHEKNHIHRDIKPDNFMMGINNNEDKLYVIDFGLAKKYRSSTKKGHIQFKTNKNITGTARYCSVNTHKGYEQSRRDDLESIGYILLYFLRGVLPWQGLKCKQDEDHYQKIYEKKKITTTEELCKGFPNQFVTYFEYVKSLAFQGDPDYEYLTNLFTHVITRYCNDIPYDFDWNNKLKSSTGYDAFINSTLQKANTSLALGNNNISRSSPNPGNSNDDSNINNQINDDVDNMSIFQRNFEDKELEHSIINGNDNIINIGEKYETKNNNTNKEKGKEENANINQKKIISNDKNQKVPINNAAENKKKDPSCRCIIY